MALSGHILCQEDASGTEAPFRSVTHFDFPPARKRDDILASWSLVPIVDVAGSGTAKKDFGRALGGVVTVASPRGANSNSRSSKWD